MAPVSVDQCLLQLLSGDLAGLILVDGVEPALDVGVELGAGRRAVAAGGCATGGCAAVAASGLTAGVTSGRRRSASATVAALLKEMVRLTGKGNFNV